MTNSEDRPPAQEPASSTTKNFTTLADHDTGSIGHLAAVPFVRGGPEFSERRAAWHRREFTHKVRVRRRISHRLDELTGARRGLTPAEVELLRPDVDRRDAA